MPKNSKPRKRYRPRSYQVAPLQMLGEHDKTVLNDDERRDLLLSAHLALNVIETGKATGEDVATMACTSNMALLLCEQGMGAEFIPDVKEAQRHIVGLDERVAQHQSIALSGPGIGACRRLLELYDAQLELPECNAGRLRLAMRTVLDRMTRGQVERPTK